MEHFPSTLIIGQNPQLKQEKVKELLNDLGHQLNNNPDLFTVDIQTGYGIAIIRQIQNFLSLHPYSHQSRIILINEIQNLETEAQNAILKNMEEPGINHYFFLTATSTSKLIATILSRCQIINLSDTKPLSSNSTLPSPKSIKEALMISDSHSLPKENIKTLLQDELSHHQQQLIDTADPQISAKLNLILTSLSLIDHNIDPKTALDYYLLKQI